MKKILTTASLTLLLASCATLISGSRQDISFDSNEKHTRIFIDGKEVCQTPCIVKIGRENSQVMGIVFHFVHMCITMKWWIKCHKFT